MQDQSPNWKFGPNSDGCEWPGQGIDRIDIKSGFFPPQNLPQVDPSISKGVFTSETLPIGSKQTWCYSLPKNVSPKWELVLLKTFHDSCRICETETNDRLELLKTNKTASLVGVSGAQLWLVGPSFIMAMDGQWTTTWAALPTQWIDLVNLQSLSTMNVFGHTNYPICNVESYIYSTRSVLYSSLHLNI